MKKLLVFLIVVLFPLSLYAKDPEVDDWPANGDGGGCKYCKVTEYVLNDIVVTTINCATPETPGNNYHHNCKIERNYCVLWDGGCSYNP